MRDQANADWDAMGAEAFRARLAERDPEIVERLKPGDRQRHVRAWEVVQSTGRPLSDWQKEQGEPAPYRFKTILLAPDRAWLRQRIETRFDVMLEQGVLDEVAAVFDRRPDPGVAGPESAWRAGALSLFPRGDYVGRGTADRDRPHAAIRQTPDDVVSSSAHARCGG